VRDTKHNPMKGRETVETIVGAVTGTLRRPEVLVVGRYRGKEFKLVGRTVTLTDDQSAEIGKLLKPAEPLHPRPDQISTHWGKGSKTPIVKVQPRLVVEVAADAAQQAGHYRHPLRLVRHRPDLAPGDVETLPSDE
jgi:ATP-dependent DNA ligase